MERVRSSIEKTAARRLRNQLSNVLIFGTLIVMTGAGLLCGAMVGVFVVGHTSLAEMHPILKLGAVILSTLIGFSSGVAMSFYVSPFVLRYAFFAKRIGEWKGVPVFAAEDADLPGKIPNVFVAGFRPAIGPFRPSIFASRTVFALLDPEALEAVFAHEVSHLELNHARKRLITGISTFISASLFTSAVLIGIQWSGYAKIGGILSIFAGLVPAALTWLSIRNLVWKQEIEADTNATRIHGVLPEHLHAALLRLQTRIGGNPHPLVITRMERLKPAPAPEPLERAA